MNELFYILTNIIFPIFIIIGIGIFMQKKFQLDLYPLTKIYLHLVTPSFIFIHIYNIRFPIDLFIKVIFFLISYEILLYTLSKLISIFKNENKRMNIITTNSILFFNSGNYGVPVNDLVFNSNPLTMSIQVMVITTQNILTFSYGIFALQSMSIAKMKAMLAYFKMPIFYSILFGILFNIYNITPPAFMLLPFEYISNAMIPLALMLLGFQIGKSKIKINLSKTYIYVFSRLVIGPIIALVMLKMMALEGIIAQTLLIASSMPSSVNSSVIAQEYNVYPEIASQIVLLTTFFSMLTVSSFIYISHIIF